MNAPRPTRRQQPADPHDVHDREAVVPRLGVVVVAEQQRLIDHRPDLAGRGLDERELQVARREFDAEQVARHAALRRQDRDRRRVRELVDASGRSVYRNPTAVVRASIDVLPAGQEVNARTRCPAGRSACRNASRLARAIAGRFARIEAHDHDVEFSAGVERQSAPSSWPSALMTCVQSIGHS